MMPEPELPDPPPHAQPASPSLFGPGALTEEELAYLTPERRRVVRWCLLGMGALGIGSWIGLGFSLWLVNNAPLLLVALSPLGRHVILAAPNSDPFLLVTVVVLRRSLFYLGSFHLGRALGPFGITWIEARAARFGRFVRWLERLFERFGYPVVLLATGPTVAMLAGISGMRTGVFLALAVPGLAVRMAVTVWFADLLREPIEVLLALADEYWRPGTVVLVGGILIYQLLRLRARRRSTA